MSEISQNQNLSLSLHQKLKAVNKRSSNLSKFTSFHDEILQALDQGFLAKDIWEELKSKGEFLGSYDTFLRYLRRLSIKKSSYEKLITKKKEKGTTVPNSNEHKSVGIGAMKIEQITKDML